MTMKTGKHHIIRKRLSALLALFCCVLFAGVCRGDDTANQTENRPDTSAVSEGVELKLDYGYRNTAKTGQMLPVTVTVENNTGDIIDGFLSVDIPGDQGSISYTSSIRVPEGTSVIKRTVTIPDGNSSTEGDRLMARLFDDTGAQIASAQTVVTYLGSGKEVLCGILSDEQQNLMYLGNISLGEKLSTRVVTLNPADLPEEEDGLNQLDIIVISSIDLNRLSETTAKAVMSWVENGGTLIMGTGANTSPLGAFRSLVGDPALGPVLAKDLDMGMQYSTSGPDGAVLNLQQRSVYWDGAKAIQQSGDRDLVLRKTFGKGSVCIAAYDFCTIKAFGSEHPDYVQNLLTAAIGQTGLARISGSLLSAEERLTVSGEMTNTYDASNLPGILGYAIGAAVFLLLAGPVLFRVLSGRGLGIYYMLGALILAMAFSLIFYLSASKTRITGPFIRYGTITEYVVSDEGLEKADRKGWLDLQSASASAITLELSQECTVRPVITNGAVSITSGKKKMLAVAGQKQFETNIFQLEQKMDGNEEELPLSVEMSLGSRGLEGTVTNAGNVTFSGLALVCRGQIISLGTLEPGESRNFESETAVKGPVLVNGLVSTYLAEKEEDVKFALQRGNLRNNFLRENVSLSEGKVLLFGFAENYLPDFLDRTEYDMEGSSLFVLELPGTPECTEDTFLRIPETEPRVISGSFDTATGCLKGSGATILEYSLGSGYQLSGMELQGLSAELEGRKVTAFSGQIAMYNYSTGSFDLVDAGKTRWNSQELTPYLSPANNLTVRFLPDEDRKGNLPVYLPQLYVEGSYVNQSPTVEEQVQIMPYPSADTAKKAAAETAGLSDGPVPETAANDARTPGDH